MELPYYICISLVLLLVSYLLTSHIRRKPSDLPPTVFPSLPLIGHLYLLKQPLLHRTLAKLSAQYGPILRLQLGFRRVLVVSSPSIAEQCIPGFQSVFINRANTLFGKSIGSLAWSSYGHDWARLRLVFTYYFLLEGRLENFQDIWVEELKFLIRKLHATSLSTVKPRSVFREFTLNVMMRMIADKRYFGDDNLEMEEEGKRLLEILDDTSVLAGASNIGDYWQSSWFGVKEGLEKKVNALQERVDVFFQGVIDDVRKQGGLADNNTMIQLLWEVQEKGNFPNISFSTDAMLRGVLLIILAAGSDTLAETIEWAMSLLLNHPHILKKAQDEIDLVIGNKRLVNESDIANLPYLRANINETFRLYPIYPLLGPYESSDDCVIAGYNIPRGTMLLVNIWAVHHDAKKCVDPEKFSPERFYELDGKQNWLKLMSFGTGEMSTCVGEKLAIRILGMTLGSIIQCFYCDRINEELVDMTEGPGVTMLKANPLVAIWKPRNAFSLSKSM